MRNDHSWQRAARAAALGLVGGLLLASGPVAIAAEDDQPAQMSGRAIEALASRPNCGGDNNVMQARYLEKGPQGLRLVTEKCKGAKSARAFSGIGQYGGACQNPSKCSAAHPGDTIDVDIELLKSELGVSADEPVAAVITSVIVQVGESTCYWYCTGSGGSQSCEKLCT